jgi:hypothetical protein
MLLLEGEYSEAIDYLLKSITLCYEMDQKSFIATGMGWLSFAFGLRQEPDPATASINAAQIGGAAEGLMDTIGLTPWSRTHPFMQMILQQIRSRVDEQTWQTAWAAGRALSLEQAIAFVKRER